VRLLRDPTAKGRRRANFSRHSGKDRLKPESEWVWSDVEPIVATELWDQCNAILDERRRTKKPPGKRPRHLFAGVTHCHCGERMYVPSNSPKYICHSCRNKIPVDDLEFVFQEQLKTFVFSPEQLLEHLEQGDRVIGEKTELLSALGEEETKIRAEMEKNYRLYQDDKISSDGFGFKYRPLEDRLKQLGDEVPRLQAEIDFMKIERLSSDEIFREAQDLSTRWPDLTPEDKRKIVENVTERITVGKDEISIDLYYLPSVSEIVAGRQRASICASPPPPRPRRTGR